MGGGGSSIPSSDRRRWIASSSMGQTASSGALAEQRPAFHLVEPAPDPVVLADAQRVLQALITDGAPDADGLGHSLTSVLLGPAFEVARGRRNAWNPRRDTRRSAASRPSTRSASLPGCSKKVAPGIPLNQFATVPAGVVMPAASSRRFLGCFIRRPDLFGLGLDAKDQPVDATNANLGPSIDRVAGGTATPQARPSRRPDLRG